MWLIHLKHFAHKLKVAITIINRILETSSVTSPKKLRSYKINCASKGHRAQENISHGSKLVKDCKHKFGSKDINRKKINIYNIFIQHRALT